jgi:hypothetical protein
VGSKLKPEGVFARRGLAVQRQNVGIEAGKFRKQNFENMLHTPFFLA